MRTGLTRTRGGHTKYPGFLRWGADTKSTSGTPFGAAVPHLAPRPSHTRPADPQHPRPSPPGMKGTDTGRNSSRKGNDAACSGAGLGPCESGHNYKSPGCEGRGGVCGAVHHVCREAAHSLIQVACGGAQVHGQTNVWPVSLGTER
ncbi:hypothetical protein E2C01_035319 [Portunus trituberculatus]|uniref:Uncharacterized protein n=1 Tax=Portunus trituberculatus TaxID=210409 RepID=A0A5B7F9F8_PORTR|nr:hypothetical protein [Portunus trituberculatus]